MPTIQNEIKTNICTCTYIHIVNSNAVFMETNIWNQWVIEFKIQNKLAKSASRNERAVLTSN